MSVRPDVAILLDHFGSGGVERVACLLANGLQRRGFIVEMVVLEDSGPVRSLLDESIAVRCLGATPGLRRGRRMMAAVPAVASYLRAHSPQLFHSPGNHTNGPAALAASLARFRGAFVPKITNPLLNDRMTPRRRLLRRTFYRWALRKAKLVLTLSPSSARRIVEMDAALASSTRFVHNPYVSERMISRSAERRPAQPPVILSMGRLSVQKNHAMLLRAAALLGNRPWRLRICGAGPEEQALRALAAELGIEDRLELPGFVSDPVPEYLAATVTALSSRWEDLPASVLEAIACGCPVVSTASSPGLVDLLRDVGAFQSVAIDDEAGLTQALKAALDGELPAVPSEASAPYGIEASCDEHAALFASAAGISASAPSDIPAPPGRPGS